MKGILLKGDKRIEPVELPDPTPGPGEVVIKIKASGVCGSDIHRYHMTAEQLGPMTSVIPGHDSAGEVVAVGEGVTTRKVGDRVIGYLKVGCMKCDYCRRGLPAHCRNLRSIGRQIHGSDGEYITIPESAALDLPDFLSYQEGAILSCNYATAYSAVRRVTADPATATVAIIGVGPVGLCALMTAHELGYRTIAVDLSDGRLAMADRLGADAIVNARREDVVQAVKDLTRGIGVEASVECSGSEVAQAQAIHIGASLGQVVLVGNGKAEATMPIGVLKAKEMVMQGSVVFHSHEYPGMLDFLASASFSLADLVEAEMPIEQAVEAFARADQGDSGKILFSW